MRAAAGALLVLGLLVGSPGLWDRASGSLRTAVPDRGDPPTASLGRTPAWSVGDHGAPGNVVVAGCAALRAARAAGRTAVAPAAPALGVPPCTLSGPSSVVDGLRIWPATR